MWSKEEAKDVIPLIWKELLERYRELQKVDEAYGQVPRLTVVGQPDTRPEQLFAALFGPPKAVCDLPAEDGDGTWRYASSFALDDVPGLGVIGDYSEAQTGLQHLRESDALVLTVQPERRPTSVEQGLHDQIKRLGRPRVVVVHVPLEHDDDSPARKPPELDQAAWERWNTELGRVLDDPKLKALAVRQQADRDLVALNRRLYDLLAEANPKLTLGFVRSVQHHDSRDALVTQMINGMSRTAAFLGLNPIPFSDAVAITPVQVLLVCRIAAAYGVKVKPSWAKEFILTSGVVGAAGLGFRAIFRQIMKGLGEVTMAVGMALGAGVAFAGTQTVGHAARLYFIHGGRITPQEAGRRAAAELRLGELPKLFKTGEEKETAR